MSVFLLVISNHPMTPALLLFKSRHVHDKVRASYTGQSSGRWHWILSLHCFSLFQCGQSSRHCRWTTMEALQRLQRHRVTSISRKLPPRATSARVHLLLAVCLTLWKLSTFLRHCGCRECRISMTFVLLVMTYWTSQVCTSRLPHLFTLSGFPRSCESEQALHTEQSIQRWRLHYARSLLCRARELQWP